MKQGSVRERIRAAQARVKVRLRTHSRENMTRISPEDLQHHHIQRWNIAQSLIELYDLQLRLLEARDRQYGEYYARAMRKENGGFSSVERQALDRSIRGLERRKEMVERRRARMKKWADQSLAHLARVGDDFAGVERDLEVARGLTIRATQAEKNYLDTAKRFERTMQRRRATRGERKEYWEAALQSLRANHERMRRHYLAFRAYGVTLTTETSRQLLHGMKEAEVAIEGIRKIIRDIDQGDPPLWEGV